MINRVNGNSQNETSLEIAVAVNRTISCFQYEHILCAVCTSIRFGWCAQEARLVTQSRLQRHSVCQSEGKYDAFGSIAVTGVCSESIECAHRTTASAIFRVDGIVCRIGYFAFIFAVIRSMFFVSTVARFTVCKIATSSHQKPNS